MKNLLSTLLVILVAGSFVVKAQDEVVYDNFDSSAVNNVYDKISEGSEMIYTDNHSDFVEGTGSFTAKLVIGSFHSWGSYAEIQKAAPDGEYLDYSGYDSLSIWIKVYQAPAQPANMVFRIQLREQPASTNTVEQYIYENAVTIDETSDWFNLKVPMQQVESDGSVNPNDQGFVIAPSSWGLGKDDGVLDYTSIISFGLVAVTLTTAADSVEVGFDNLTLFSPQALPAVFFNGIAFPAALSTWTWGQSTIEVEAGAGPVENSNAIKWVQGDEWANGWTGWGASISPVYNLAVAWEKDTAQFKIKAESGVGELRFQLEDGTAGGKRGWNFTPTDDGEWHTYKVALKDLIYPPGEDQAKIGPIDSSSISVVGLMAEASAVAGKVVYITDWWTGNPTFDVIPPNAPQNVSAFTGEYKNIILWEDVSGETGEKYDVYYSKNPITDVTADGVEIVDQDIAENNQSATHLLLAPATDQDVTYYYAVICKDASGNSSVVSANSSAITNTAKGVPTISLIPPSSFAADGDLSEWESITPFRMFISDGTGHEVTNTTISSDADCSALSWVAVDETYLYVAFDVTDDVFVPDAQSTSYLNDAPDIYLGLYNWHGVSHVSLKRGASPDYHLRFAYNRVIIDNISGADSIVGIGDDYYYGEAFGSGYRVEFRIKWTDLAAWGTDSVFTPVEGYRIPIDYSINDADATNEREGILTYSANNEDLSYGDVSRWTYTWIGNL